VVDETLRHRRALSAELLTEIAHGRLSSGLSTGWRTSQHLPCDRTPSPGTASRSTTMRYRESARTALTSCKPSISNASTSSSERRRLAAATSSSPRECTRSTACCGRHSAKRCAGSTSQPIQLRSHGHHASRMRKSSVHQGGSREDPARRREHQERRTVRCRTHSGPAQGGSVGPAMAGYQLRGENPDGSPHRPAPQLETRLPAEQAMWTPVRRSLSNTARRRHGYG
jgi:hypothetical protein